MMTGRSEYRLVLRHDNAEERLIKTGRELGLVSEQRYQLYLDRRAKIDAEKDRICSASIPPSEELNELLTKKGTSAITQSVKFIELLKRPQLSYNDIARFDKGRPQLAPELIEKLEIEVKYEGYIKTQTEKIQRMQKLEEKLLPPDTDYSEISGLRLEAREKLNLHKPLSIGQAARISGVNPADISVLLIWLEGGRHGQG